VRQSRPTGLADAVAEAEEFVGDAPFLVSLGDSIIASDAPGRLIDRMIECYQHTGAACVLALEEVPVEEVHHYGVAQLVDDGNRWSRIRDLVEKPEPGAEPSRLTLAGRYLFTPEIFSCIRATPQISRTGSRELTDAVRVLIGQGTGVYAVKLDANERRYDIGDFASYFRAFFDFALEDERYGYTLWQHLIRRGVEPDPLQGVPRAAPRAGAPSARPAKKGKTP
jgi:UTP--glucose-1-phosphate uridylyltransferase